MIPGFVSDLLDPAISRIGNTLHNALDQSVQNGGGYWGTVHAPRLPHFRSDGGTPIVQGAPWGSISATNRNPYTSQPNTGVTRNYDFTLSRCTISPDGVQVPHAVCVNGQFPGPLVEANYGDYIQVTVHNQLPDEGTTLHWHGMLQTDTPWADGVPAVDQCPIAPGHSFQYRFRANLYGSTWYHSHYSAQYSAAAQGPLVVHGPSNVGYDFDLGPVMLTDWYHVDYKTLVEQTMAPLGKGGPNAPLSNNNLINGKMTYDCSKTDLPCTPEAGLSKFKFQSGKSHRLRLVNSGAQAIQKFSIDGHNMTVIANDFVPVHPYIANHVSLGVGQRADVLVSGSGGSGEAYWMRSNIKGCSNNDGVSPLALAAIYYEGADEEKKPNTLSTVNDDAQMFCANDPLQTTIPTYPVAISDPSTTDEIDITLGSNGTHELYYMNNQTFHGDYNDPVLLEANHGNLSYPDVWAVHNYGSNKSVRLVVNNYDTAFHPMHLHGHNMEVLSVGFGLWDGSIVRAGNPQRRDTQLLPPGSPSNPSHMVIQWSQDNPGVWPFHCHIAWHLSAGLYLNVLERPNEIRKYNQVPGIVAQTCRTWAAFTRTHMPDQIDDGL